MVHALDELYEKLFRKKFRILSFLNKCITPMGKREFKYNLLNPIHNIKKLNYSYECIEYFLNNSIMTDFLVENLKYIKDIEKMNRLIYLKNSLLKFL